MFLTSQPRRGANLAAVNGPTLPVYMLSIPSEFLTPAMIRRLRVEHERKKKHKFRRDRCFNRFRVLELDQLRALPRANGSTHASGVYFLWDGPRLAYIGKGVCIHDRLATHRRNGVRFTHATFEELNQTCALWCEAQYIRRHKPPLNTNGKR